MSAQLIIREPLGERRLPDQDLPVSIGGAGSDIVVPAPAPGPLAWIGAQDGQLFLQPRRRTRRAAQRCAHCRRRRGCAAATCSTSRVAGCACASRAASGCSKSSRAPRTTRRRRRRSRMSSACRARVAMRRRSRRSPSDAARPTQQTGRAVPWRRVGIAAGFALLGRAGPVSVYVGSGEQSTSIQRRSAWLRGRLAGSGLRRQPAGAPRQVHTGCRARGLRATARPDRGHPRRQAAVPLQPADIAGPPADRAAGGRQGEHRRQAGRQRARRVQARGRTAQDPDRHRALPRLRDRHRDRGQGHAAAPGAEAGARVGRWCRS